jgi:uncharacterized protein YuzE
VIARKIPLNYDMIRKAEIGERALANVREVEFDPDASAGYFMIMPSATIVATTERRVNIDWDVDGNIIGIELLDILAPPRNEETT